MIWPLAAHLFPLEISTFSNLCRFEGYQIHRLGLCISVIALTQVVLDDCVLSPSSNTRELVCLVTSASLIACDMQ